MIDEVGGDEGDDADENEKWCADSDDVNEAEEDSTNQTSQA